MKQDKDIENILIKIGLNTQEIAIYFLCLEYGSIWISTIARLLKIARTTINDRVEKLCNEGILIAEKINKWSKYHAANWQELIDLFHLKNQKNLEIINTIKEQKETRTKYDHKYNTLPKITFYEWWNVYKNFALKMKAVSEAAFITDIDATLNYNNITIKELIKEYYLWKGKNIREIVFDTKNWKEYAKLMNKKWQKVKILEINKKININSDIALIKDYYYHVSYWDICTWFEIYNPVFYEINLLIFNQLRNSLN